MYWSENVLNQAEQRIAANNLPEDLMEIDNTIAIMRENKKTNHIKNYKGE